MNDALGEALGLCAQDAGGNGAAPRVVGRSWRKGKWFLLVAAGGDRSPGYVVKLAPRASYAAKWMPEREFEGLRALEAGAPGARAYGFVRAIGFGVAPRYVVMTYHRAPTLMRCISRAVRRPNDQARMRRAMLGARLAGRWVSHFQRLHPVTEPAASGAERYLRRCVRYIAEIESSVGGGLDLRNCEACIKKAVAALDERQVAELTGERLCHGDLNPSNILLDDEGVFRIIDTEAMRPYSGTRDLVAFRKGMKFCAGRMWGGVPRWAPLWSAFWDAYVDGGGSAEVAALSCLEAALARVAGHERPRRGWGWLCRWHSAIGRFDKARCFRLEQRWLHGVRGGLPELCDHARNEL